MKRAVAIIASISLYMDTTMAASAQQSVLQGGPWISGHVPMYASPSGPVVIDSGAAAGGGPGVGLSELNLTLRGNGMPPYANAGTGPFSTNLCDFDAPRTNSSGYHFLCLSPNASAGGLLTYGAAGGAPQLPFQFNINGTFFTLPSTGFGNVVGPSSAASGNIPIFSGATGKIIADSGVAASSLAPIANVLLKSNNLSDVASASTALVNIGGIGASTTNTLTNKMISGASNTISNIGNTSLTNSSIMLNGSAVALGGTRTLSLASPDFANQGTATTTLHGNATGSPSFSAISLGTDITGILAASNGGLGADNSAATGVPLFTSGSVAITSTSGTGNFVRATSPTLITPVLGVASGTSLLLSNLAGTSNRPVVSDASGDLSAPVTANFSANNNGTSQVIPANTSVSVAFGTASINNGSFYNTSTSAFTPPSGIYSLSSTIQIETTVTISAAYFIIIRKNGTLIAEKQFVAPNANAFSMDINCLSIANGTDAFTIVITSSGASSSYTVDGSSINSYFTGSAQ